MRRLVATSVVVLLAVGLIAAVPAEAKKNSFAIALDYFNAMFKQASPNEAKVKKLVEPGSLAEKYATFQVAVSRALRDAGQAETEGNKITFQGKSIKTCFIGSTPSGTQTCTTFTKFKAKKGKLVSFLAEGEDLTSRLVVNPAQQSGALGATATLVAAYRSVSGDELLIVIDLTAPADGQRQAQVYSANYLTPDNRQVQVQNASGPTGYVQPGLTASYIISVPGVDPGGTLLFAIDSGEPNYDTANIQLKIA